MALKNLFSATQNNEDDSEILTKFPLNVISDNARELAKKFKISYVYLENNEIIKVNHYGKKLRTIGIIKKRERLKSDMSYDIT